MCRFIGENDIYTNITHCDSYRKFRQQSEERSMNRIMEKRDDVSVGECDGHSNREQKNETTSPRTVLKQQRSVHTCNKSYICDMLTAAKRVIVGVREIW